MFKDWGARSWTGFALLWLGAVGLTRMAYRPASDSGSFALMALAACLCAVLVKAFNSRAAKTPASARATASAADTVDPAPVRDTWQALGADPQTREESIRRLFDTRSGTVEFETQWDFDYAYQHDSGAIEQAYSSMSFRLARPLEELGSRESEVLRTAYRLYNEGLIDAQTWRDLTFGSIYGAGAATIISCEYREPVALPFSDDAGAIRYYADAHAVTLEATERKLCDILDTGSAPFLANQE